MVLVAGGRLLERARESFSFAFVVYELHLLWRERGVEDIKYLSKKSQLYRAARREVAKLPRK